MKEILQWLRKIEQYAGEIYNKSAVHLSSDVNFSSFLSSLVEDEAQHYHLMGSALVQISESKKMPISEIIFDESISMLMEKPLKILSDRLESNEASKQDVVNCIVEAEFSEWNDVFLYSINLLKKESWEFQYAAASIQDHKNRIVEFLKTLPPDIVFSKKIFELTPIWEKKILVVDDDEPLRELISSIVSTIGLVDVAANGLEALEKMRKNFYSVIVSDIDMPVMNGLVFFQKAYETDSLVSKRFVFCSGDITGENEDFFKKNNTPYLNKPFHISTLKEIINERISESV